MIPRLIQFLLGTLTCMAAIGAAPVIPDDAAVTHTDSTIAFIHARVIDGLGHPVRTGETLLIADGVITDIGTTVDIPPHATVIDLAGKTVMPGLIMAHEHNYYSSLVGGPFHMNYMAYSFPRMYLAAGVTTARTTGSLEPYTDLELKRRIAVGSSIGPDYFLTAPYVDGPETGITQLHGVEDAADARRMISYWAAEGFTSVKLYVNLPSTEMRAAIETAHTHNMQVTGHIGKVSYREATALGIDNIEHGFLAASDWVPGRITDETANIGGIYESIAALDPASDEATAVIQYLVDQGVALTSTLAIFETFTGGRPPVGEAELAALAAPLRESYLKTWAAINQADTEVRQQAWANNLKMEVDFFRRGGLLVVGTDPTGYGGCLAGYGSWRAIELLVEAGLTPLEAIKCATSNGARLLGIADHRGRIKAGYQADLIIIDGAPDQDIADLRKTETVFKAGIGYNSATLFQSAAGKVGIQ